MRVAFVCSVCAHRAAILSLEFLPFFHCTKRLFFVSATVCYACKTASFAFERPPVQIACVSEYIVWQRYLTAVRLYALLLKCS